MKAYTYFSQIDCLNDPELIRLWEQSWRHYGWQTVILNEMDARNADNDMVVRFEKSPLMKSCPGNPVQYTRSAMMRWVCMTQVSEPCIHLDWDVLCNGYTPDMVQKPYPNLPVFLSGSTCPCAIFGTPEAWKHFSNWLEIAPTSERFSAADLMKDSCDQYAWSIAPANFSIIDPSFPCKLYREHKGWETAPMIHFPNRLTPSPRSQTIKQLNLHALSGLHS